MHGDRACRTCGEAKPLSEFWADKGRTDGLQSECKTCMKNRNNAWQRANKATRHPQKLASVYRRRRIDPIRAWFKGIRQNAQARGIAFSLTIEDLTIPAFCPVLGIPLKSNYGHGSKRTIHDKDHAPSVDRIDNTKGYHKDNIVIVSFRANRLKSDATVDELEKVVAFYAEGQRRKSSAIEPNRGDVSHRDAQVYLPPVQSRSQEEGATLPFGIL